MNKDEIKEIIEIMPESSSKEDEEKALMQKLLVDELTGVKDNGIIKKLIDEEFEALKKQ